MRAPAEKHASSENQAEALDLKEEPKRFEAVVRAEGKRKSPENRRYPRSDANGCVIHSIGRPIDIVRIRHRRIIDEGGDRCTRPITKFVPPNGVVLGIVLSAVPQVMPLFERKPIRRADSRLPPDGHSRTRDRDGDERQRDHENRNRRCPQSATAPERRRSLAMKALIR